MIAHPHSPFKGQHYQYPVELIDVYPTLNDLLLAPNDMKEICKGFVICRPLQGKSLAKVVVGDAIYNNNFKKSNSNYGSTLGYVWQAVTQSIKKNSHDSNGSMPEMKMKFALSQKIRCADRKKLEEYTIARSTGVLTKRKGFVWGDCDLLRKPQDVLAVMGYSMRTIQYRYTSYYYYNLSTSRPELSSSPYSQELYYHGNDTDGDNNQAELYNLATKPTHGATVSRLHEQLTDFIRSKVSFSHRNKS